MEEGGAVGTKRRFGSPICHFFICSLSLLIMLLSLPVSALAAPTPKTFATPEEAAAALAAAYQADDRKAVVDILGDKAGRLVFSGDRVIDRHERMWFLSLYDEGQEVVPDGEERAVLQIGKDGQPYPIPILKKESRWRFDASEGHEELLSRRISKTELTALNVVTAFVDAQREYRESDPTGSGLAEYAQRFRSSPGQHDGLYWEDMPSKAEGPMAVLAEAASREGYVPSKGGELPVYRGYFYKILTAQGPRADGGAREYIINGHMTDGYALVAFPARYGISGIMTFMVNQDGVIYQKDIGRRTGEIGRKMTRFDPDNTWTRGGTAKP